jgi:hypothetical protein
MLSVYDKLTHAVTQYDIRQSKRKGYNVNALGIYLGSCQAVQEDLAAGKPVRQSLVSHFCGRLLDVCLKAVGEPTSTLSEQRF